MNYLLFILISYFNLSQTTEKFDLKITVTNVKSQKGIVEIGLFNDQKSFLIKGKEYKTSSKVVTDDSVVFILTDLPKADYAVSIYHDINSDKECNMNFLGIPKEPYGFSQNFKPKFSKPTFDDCKIELKQNQSIVIKLLD